MQYPKVGFCQSCGREVVPQTDLVEDAEVWVYHRLPVDEEIVILVCPECDWLPLGELFDRYKKLVREGRDPRFH